MANRRGMAKVIHSDNQTPFHKAAKVFKASTQKMRLMISQSRCKLEIHNGESQSSWRSLEESLPTTQRTTQEGVGESFS